MSKKQENKNNFEKLGINDDALSLGDLDKITAEFNKKPMPKNEFKAYPRQKVINGRPYYYLIWYEKDADGKRRQKSIYLGSNLPKGYSLGKPIKIASAK